MNFTLTSPQPLAYSLFQLNNLNCPGLLNPLYQTDVMILYISYAEWYIMVSRVRLPLRWTFVDNFLRDVEDLSFHSEKWSLKQIWWFKARRRHLVSQHCRGSHLWFWNVRNEAIMGTFAGMGLKPDFTFMFECTENPRWSLLVHVLYLKIYEPFYSRRVHHYSQWQVSVWDLCYVNKCPLWFTRLFTSTSANPDDNIRVKCFQI